LINTDSNTYTLRLINLFEITFYKPKSFELALRHQAYFAKHKQALLFPEPLINLHVWIILTHCRITLSTFLNITHCNLTLAIEKYWKRCDRSKAHKQSGMYTHYEAVMFLSCQNVITDNAYI